MALAIYLYKVHNLTNKKLETLEKENKKLKQNMEEWKVHVCSKFRHSVFTQEETSSEIEGLKAELRALKEKVEDMADWNDKMSSALRDYFGMLLFSGGQIAYSQGRNLMDVFNIKASDYCDVEKVKELIEYHILDRIDAGRGDYYQHQPYFVKVDTQNNGYIKIDMSKSENQQKVENTFRSYLPWITVSNAHVLEPNRTSSQQGAYVSSKAVANLPQDERYEIEYGSRDYNNRHKGLAERVMDTLKFKLNGL